ncbi:MAG TPA: shikimate kinase [Erysipelotrichaceae bacterium]|nr:shikimate kinase [Erysipelotrichaceae bacterium]
MIRDREKKNIVLIGMPTSGKTTFAALLSRETGIPAAEMDDEIISMLGTSIRECFETKGEAYFRRLETEAAKILSEGERKIISCGGGAVTVPETMRILSEHGEIYWLKRDLEKLFPTDSRPLSASAEALKQRYEERLPLYQKYCDVIIDNNGTIDETLRQLLACIRKENA